MRECPWSSSATALSSLAPSMTVLNFSTPSRSGSLPLILESLLVMEPQWEEDMESTATRAHQAPQENGWDSYEGT